MWQVGRVGVAGRQGGWQVGGQVGRAAELPLLFSHFHLYSLLVVHQTFRSVSFRTRWHDGLLPFEGEGLREGRA